MARADLAAAAPSRQAHITALDSSTSYPEVSSFVVLAVTISSIRIAIVPRIKVFHASVVNMAAIDSSVSE